MLKAAFLCRPPSVSSSVRVCVCFRQEVDALYVFTEDTFKAWLDAVFERDGGYDPTRKDHRAVRSGLNGAATTLEIDSAARISLPEADRNPGRISIARRQPPVTVDRLTIWNRQAYAEHQADVDDALANFFDRESTSLTAPKETCNGRGHFEHPEYRHEPVMLPEVLEGLDLKPGSVVCDCTLGGAGHSVKMAAQVGETGLLLGIDQDDMALEAAGKRLDTEAPGTPHKLLKGNFGDLDRLLCSAQVPGVDAFLFDLGVSSPATRFPWKGLFVSRRCPLRYADGCE